MADQTWLQCQIPREEWNKLNERRLALKLKWVDVLIPATEQYLKKLENKKVKREEVNSGT